MEKSFKMIRRIGWMLTLLGLVLAFGCAEDETRQPASREPTPAPAAGFTLSYTADAGGTIVGESRQRVKRGEDGTGVRAQAAEGYAFVAWSDGVAEAVRTERKVNADLRVSARFAPRSYTLTYAAAAGGRIDGDSPQRVSHGGDGRAVTAVPAAGYRFAGWSDGQSEPLRRDLRVTADETVRAQFARLSYVLSYRAEANGSLRGTSEQRVEHEGFATPVAAVPDPGYHFLRWSDGSTANPRSDRAVGADLEVRAEFAVNQYRLNYQAGANGAITGESRQLVNHGGDGRAVTAVPQGNASFVRWSDGVTSATRKEQNLVGDLELTAEFALPSYTVGGRLSGLAAGSRLQLQLNGGAALELSADGSFSFQPPLLDGSDYLVTILAQPTAPSQICTLGNATGTLEGAAIANIQVDCVPARYAVGGSLSGLPEGGRLLLQNNRTDNLELSGNGPFSFSRPLAAGLDYAVTIFSRELRPKWSCRLDRAVGTVVDRDVTDIEVVCYPDAELEATAGFGKIDLSWNQGDFSGATFNLCLAREAIPADGFLRCRSLRDGLVITGLTAPKTLPRLPCNVPYWLQLEVSHAGGQRSYSKVLAVVPYSGFNDTGIDWCADDRLNRFMSGMRLEKADGCQELAASHPGQDGDFGRDVTARSRKLSKTGGGSGGFDFTRICASGQAAGSGSCPPNPSLGDGPDNWACTRDNVTGLMWEVKTADGLRGRENTYSWYSSDEAVNGGAIGTQNGGQCRGSACDTQAYVEAVNAQGLCGGKDWRLPSRKELLSIVDNGRMSPAVDSHYFPATKSVEYWSASPYAALNSQAWQVLFRFGETYPGEKSQGSAVRLVRQAP